MEEAATSATYVAKTGCAKTTQAAPPEPRSEAAPGGARVAGPDTKPTSVTEEVEKEVVASPNASGEAVGPVVDLKEPPSEPEHPPPILTRSSRVREGCLHLLIAITWTLVGLTLGYACARMAQSSSYSLGCVSKYCYRSPAWIQYCFGEQVDFDVCSEHPPVWTPFTWEEVRRCGIVHKRQVITAPIIHQITMFWSDSFPDFEDAPLFLGLGKWLEFFELGERTVRTVMILDIWGAKQIVLAGGVAAVALAWAFRESIGYVRSLVEWVFVGDEVPVGVLGRDIDAAVNRTGVDPELLSHLVSNVTFKPRDTRTMANLMSQGRAWVNSKRPKWTERESVSQIAEAAMAAMSLTTVEAVAYKTWGSGLIYGGLVRARQVMGGLLKWGRRLPE